MALTESEELELLELENENATSMAAIAQKSIPQPIRRASFSDRLNQVLTAAGGLTAGPAITSANILANYALKNPRQTVIQGADLLPAAGAIAAPLAVTLPTGGAAAPAAVAASALGATGGEGVRQMVRRAVGVEAAPPVDVPIPFLNKTIPRIPGVSPEISNLLTQGGVGAAQEFVGQGIGKLGNQARESAISMSRRSLGNTKANLTSTKSWADALRKQATANRAAEMMLDTGNISKTGSTSKTLKNALKIKDAASSGLGNVLKSADESGGALNVKNLTDEMTSALKPKYPDEIAAVQKIANDIAANGDTVPLMVLKTEIKPQLGRAWETPPTGRAVDITRRAGKFIENKIASTIDNRLGSEAGKLYRTNNATFGKAVTALRTLAPQQAMEMGNAFPSLRSSMAAGARLAAGDIPGAIGSLGAIEWLLRRGAGLGANVLNSGSRLMNGQNGPILLKAISARRKKENE